MTQTQKARHVMNLAGTLLPSQKNSIKVGSLLSKEDEEFLRKNGVGLVAVENEGQYFFLSTQHRVPGTAQIVRQEEGQYEGQVLGIPAVVGG